MTRDEVLAAIDAAYAARQSGDLSAMSGFWAEDATFEFAGDPRLLPQFPGTTGPEDSEPAVAALMRFITMSRCERLQALVEGDRAVTLSRVTVSFAGRVPFETTICDLWHFDETGRIRSLVQFSDTARVALELHAMSK
jgi:ketosteroid isomerase-like protein